MIALLFNVEVPAADSAKESLANIIKPDIIHTINTIITIIIIIVG